MSEGRHDEGTDRTMKAGMKGQTEPGVQAVAGFHKIRVYVTMQTTVKIHTL